MSDDYDVKIWKEVKFEEVAMNIDTLSREDLIKIAEAEKNCLLSKFEKLNVLLKNLNVYCKGGVLLVNDRYGICSEFPEIAAAFGFITKPVEPVACALKGKNYLIYDPLFELIRALDPAFDISKFANKQPNEQILSALQKVDPSAPISDKLQTVLQTILREGHYTVKGTQKIVTTYEDGREINRDVGAVVSDRDVIIKELNLYSQAMQDLLKKANTDLQSGTVKLLCHRARQMGYSIKEERKGTQVQLVLVRAE